jgi:hypothetical protein
MSSVVEIDIKYAGEYTRLEEHLRGWPGVTGVHTVSRMGGASDERFDCDRGR